MEARPETGVMQFGDDWPGVFVRGDTAAILAEQLADAIGEPDPGAGPDTLGGLLSLLRSAGRAGGAVQHVKAAAVDAGGGQWFMTDQRRR